MKYSLPLLLLPLLAGACGETVNYDTEEKFASNDSIGNAAPSEDAVGGDTSSGDPSAVHPACQAAVLQVQEAQLLFPEIPAGTTCAFGSGDNLSRRDRFFRAYIRQTQTVELPEGAILCGFSLNHKTEGMRYDDEMFFLLNERILLATKDYKDFFSIEGDFYRFSWESLRGNAYDPSAATIPYCAGGAEGLSSCSVPPTETEGSIELTFSDTMNQRLSQALQNEKTLNFDWITTGDNDDSDCRHSDIVLDLALQYVIP